MEFHCSCIIRQRCVRGDRDAQPQSMQALVHPDEGRCADSKTTLLLHYYYTTLAEQIHFEESGAWLAKLDVRGPTPSKDKEKEKELSDLLADPAGLPLVITCNRRSLAYVLGAGTTHEHFLKRENVIATLSAGNRLCCLDFMRPSSLLFSVHVKEDDSISVIVSHVRALSNKNPHKKRQYKFLDFVGKGGCLGGCWGLGFYYTTGSLYCLRV